MTERPILFSAPMVRAILDGRKTQTRRIVKHPDARGYAVERDAETEHGFMFLLNGDHGFGGAVNCPYGAPGDRLWVQEACALTPHGADGFHVTYPADGTERFVQLSTDEEAKYAERKFPLRPTPGRFMYRSASRITLAVESVRVERLHDISEEDAQKEGAPVEVPITWAPAALCHRGGFERLWHEINSAESWEANPWVWVIGFAPILGRL